MRRWSAKEKVKIVLEVLSGQRTVAEACRAHEVAESVLYRWQREFLDNAHAAFSPSCAEQEARVRELERLVGQMALELEVLKKPRDSTGKGKAGAGDDPPGSLPPPPAVPGPWGAPEHPLLPA